MSLHHTLIIPQQIIFNVWIHTTHIHLHLFMKDVDRCVKVGLLGFILSPTIAL